MRSDVTEGVKEAMRGFFDRMMRQWEETGLGLPRAPWDPDVDAWFWQSPADEDEYATWRPVEKTEHHDVGQLGPGLRALHPSVDAYFNSWWFAALEGQLGRYGITMMPVLPGIELNNLLLQARGYAQAHGGRLDHVPLGVEFNGLQVVVDNDTGEVAIEDYERGTFETIATSLAALIERLEP